MRQPRSEGRLVFHRHLGKREDPGDEVDSNPGGQPGVSYWGHASTFCGEQWLSMLSV